MKLSDYLLPLWNLARESLPPESKQLRADLHAARSAYLAGVSAEQSDACFARLQALRKRYRADPFLAYEDAIFANYQDAREDERAALPVAADGITSLDSGGAE